MKARLVCDCWVWRRSMHLDLNMYDRQPSTETVYLRTNHDSTGQHSHCRATDLRRPIGSRAVAACLPSEAVDEHVHNFFTHTQPIYPLHKITSSILKFVDATTKSGMSSHKGANANKRTSKMIVTQATLPLHPANDNSRNTVRMDQIR